MPIYDDMRQKVKDLRESAEQQKKNWLNKQEHHLAMTEGLSAVLCQIDTAEAESNAERRKFAALDQKRARAVELLTQAVMHLESVGYLDGSGGQALQLARFARRELEP